VNLAGIEARIDSVRSDDMEVVVVLGLGFVGTAVVANLSRCVGGSGAPQFFVIGLELDNAPGREKVARLDAGRSPIYAADGSLEAVFARAGSVTHNLVGTVDPQVLRLADTVISCINLDLNREPFQTEKLHCPTENYAAAMRMVGRHIRPETLVTVESTLPLGMCDAVLYPALVEGFREQGIDTTESSPLLAYCYERVMPGPGYLDSVNQYWRAYSGIDTASADRAEAFLAKYVDTATFPLWRHKSTRAAEMAKLLENSYRATNIAFIEEWARLAEGARVDLFDVIASIRVRKGTHDNLMRPGLGVGGYCLTKDALLAAYGAENLLGLAAHLPFSRRAILVNEAMPLRAIELIERHFAGGLAGRKAALFGVTYRPGVADTRSSPTEIVARGLAESGVAVTAYDPLVSSVDTCPQLACTNRPEVAVDGADMVVVCLPDPLYRGFLADLLRQSLAEGAIVIDPWNLIADDVADDFARRGIALEVFGRGDLPAGTSSLASGDTRNEARDGPGTGPGEGGRS